MIVADEPDPHAPDDWRIHAYFAEQPTDRGAGRCSRRLAANGEPEVEHLEDTTDWVTMSQQGLRPDPRRPLLRPHADALCRPARGRDQLRDRRRPRLRHRPARDHRRLPRRARPAGARRASASPTSPTSAPAPACSPSRRWRCGPRQRRIATDIDQIAVEVSERECRDQRREARPRPGRAAARGRRRHGLTR